MKQETLKDVLCCGKPASIFRDIDVEGFPGVGIACESCGTKTADVDESKAIESFRKIAKKPPVIKKEIKQKVNNNTQIALRNPADISTTFHNMEKDMAVLVSPVLNGDTVAMERLWNNNIDRYPLALTGPAWDKIWASQEGQQSIKHGIEEALMTPCELGVTGDLVPMGKTCVFIPAVEALEFALTYGKNAPFETINIKCIYEGDEYQSGEKNGSYFLNILSEGKKETVEMVSVSGEIKKNGVPNGIIVGETYSAKRLLEKAEAHSTPYKNYLKIMKAFAYQKSEGNTKIDANGREFFSYFTIKDTATDKYFQKSVDNFYSQESAGKLKKDSRGEYAEEKFTGKNGKADWSKKLYRSELEGGKEEQIIFIDDLTNPYAGADQPELLRKTAGKSFLNKYKKVRNTAAAMDEVKTSKQAVKQTMKMANEQFEDDVIEGY